MAHSICRSHTVARRENRQVESGEKEEVEELPPYFHFLKTTPLGRQLLSLYQAGVVDRFGDPCEEWAQKRLPSLSLEEMQPLQIDLFKQFQLDLGEGRIVTFSVGHLMHVLLTHEVQREFNFELQTLSLIGDDVRDYLFSETHYDKRVFQELNIAELYVEGCSSSSRRKPVRMLRTGILYQKGACHFQQNVIPLLLARIYLVQAGYRVQDSVKEAEITQAVKARFSHYPHPIETTENSFALFPFETSPIHWMAYFNNTLKRTHVFTADALTIPVYPLLFRLSDTTKVIPECSQLNEMQCFFHCLLHLIKAHERSSIDERGWIRFIDNLVHSDDSGQSGLGDELLLKVNLFKLKGEIGKWASKNHFRSETLFCFTLLICQHGSAYLNSEDIASIQKTHLASLSSTELSPVIQEVLALWGDEKIPFEILVSFLQIAGFLSIIHQGSKNEAISFEMGAWDFEKPVIKCAFNHAVLPLELNLKQALTTVLHFHKEENELWEKVEGRLCNLLKSLYAPATEDLVLERKVSEALSLEALQQTLQYARQTPSPLLKYLGLILAFSMPDTVQKQELAETHFHEVLSLAQTNPAIKAQFEHVIGAVDTIPDCASEDFLHQWITLLFQHGRNSEERAYTVWKRTCLDAAHLDFSLKLIRTLAHKQPAYALRLFASLNKHKLLHTKCTDSANRVLGCFALLEKRSPSEEHKRLLEYMGRTLATLIADPSFTFSRDKKTFTASIGLICRFLEESGLNAASERLTEVCSSKNLLEEVLQTKSVEEPVVPALTHARVETKEREKLDKCITTLNELMEKPSLSRKEIKKAISLYQAGVQRKLFTKDQEAGILLFLVPRLQIDELYKIPAVKQIKGVSKPTPQAKGLLIPLIALLGNAQSLQKETKIQALSTLIPILQNVTLTRGNKQSLNIILSEFFPLLEEEKAKRDLIALCALRGFTLGKSKEACSFWLNTLKHWHAEDDGTHFKTIARLYAIGVSQEYEDRAFSEMLEAEKSKKIEEDLRSYFTAFIKKTSFTSEEIKRCTGRLKSYLSTASLSSEHELALLTLLFLHNAEDPWVFAHYLERFNTPNSLSSLKEECRLKAFQALMAHLPGKTLSKGQKEALTLHFTTFFPLLLEENDKRTCILCCTDRNLSFDDSIKGKNFWLSTLKSWLVDHPQEVKKIERCYQKGVSLGFVSFELETRLALVQTKEAFKQGKAPESQWIDAAIEGFPSCIHWGELLSTLTGAMKENSFKHRKRFWIELVSKKDISIPDLLVLHLVEHILASKDLKEIEALILWLARTHAFEGDADHKHLKLALESLVHQIYVARAFPISKELMAALGNKYFALLDSAPAHFWLECTKTLTSSSQDNVYVWFKRLIGSGRMIDPGQLQQLYHLTINSLCRSSDPRLVEFLDHHEECQKVLASHEESVLSFYSLIHLSLGSCFHLQQSCKKGHDQKDPGMKQQLTRLMSIRDSVHTLIEKIPPEKAEECRRQIGRLDMSLLRLFLSTGEPRYIEKGHQYLKILLSSQKTADSYALEAWEFLECISDLEEFDYFEEVDILCEKVLEVRTCPTGTAYANICGFLLKNPTANRVYNAIRIWRLYFKIEEKKEGFPTSDHQEQWTFLNQILSHVLEEKEQRSVNEAVVALHSFLICLRIKPPPIFEEAYFTRALKDFAPLMDKRCKVFLKGFIREAKRHFTLGTKDYSPTILSNVHHGLIALCRLNVEDFMNLAIDYWLFIRDLEETYSLKILFIKELMEAALKDPEIKKEILPFLETCMEHFPNIEEEEVQSLLKFLNKLKV